jgi:hypothetical protein
MPRVVPSVVVRLVDRVYQGTIGVPEHEFGEFNSSYAGSLAGLVDLVDQIPLELMTLNADDSAALVACKSEIRYWVEHWLARGDVGIFKAVKGYPGQNAITLLRSCLVKCPDAAPAPTTTGLDFVVDPYYRESLRTDISTAFSAENNGEWKPATVVAGSVVEALLLLVLQYLPPVVVGGHAQQAQHAGFQMNPGLPLDRWTLGQYIEVAKRCGTISEGTAAQCRLAQEFRNLIHPGRAARLGTTCTRATALSALAAVEHVVDDLSDYCSSRGITI